MKHMLFKASFGMFALACSQAALADPHHATPVALAVCDDSGQWFIEYAAETWIQPPTAENCLNEGFEDKDSCGNPAIGIYTYDNPSQGAGPSATIEGWNLGPGFPVCDATGNPNLQAIQALESPDYTLGGSFLSPNQTPGTTIWLATKPLAFWDDGRVPACKNPQTRSDYRQTSVTIPFELCEPRRFFEGLTPGFWANSSSCTNGNQFKQATKQFNKGDDPRRITLDENLPQTVGLLFIAGDTTGGSVYDGENNADCETGVRILKSRTVDTGKNSSSDAAYKLARSLLAYLLNTSGPQPSYSCPLAQDAADEAQDLLEFIEFDGTGKYLKKSSAMRDEALFLNEVLDEYNNNTLGELCDA